MHTMSDRPMNNFNETIADALCSDDGYEDRIAVSTIKNKCLTINRNIQLLAKKTRSILKESVSSWPDFTEYDALNDIYTLSQSYEVVEPNVEKNIIPKILVLFRILPPNETSTLLISLRGSKLKHFLTFYAIPSKEVVVRRPNNSMLDVIALNNYIQQAIGTAINIHNCDPLDAYLSEISSLYNSLHSHILGDIDKN